MTHEVIPDVAGLPRNIEYQLTEYGGHVGFVGGTLKNRTCGWNIAFRPGFPLIWTSRRDHSLARTGNRHPEQPNRILCTARRHRLRRTRTLAGTEGGGRAPPAENGEVVLVWSELHESVNIMPRGQFRAGQEEI